MSFSVFQLEKNFWHLFLLEDSYIAHRKFQVHPQSLAISWDQKARSRTDSAGPLEFGLFHRRHAPSQAVSFLESRLE